MEGNEMKTVIVYYSFTGSTRRLSKKLAEETGADLCEIKEAAERSKLSAYVLGSFAAMRQKKVNLQSFGEDLAQYDKIVIAMPIWAGYPAPAINSLLDMLPEGKDVELIMVSGSGSSGGSAEKTKALVRDKGCRVAGYKDVKTSSVE